MASLFLRIILLIIYINTYLQLLAWWKQPKNDALTSYSHGSIVGETASGEEFTFSAHHIHQSFNSSSQWTKLRLYDQSCQPLPTDQLLLPWPFSLIYEILEQSTLSSTTLKLLWTKDDLFSASFVAINALTILDLVLSRRTKPWRFFLRVLYRVSRSNVKWAFLCLFSYIWLQVCTDQLVDIVMVVIRLPALTTTGTRMQQAWITLRSHPILSILSFTVFNLIAGSIIHRLMPRSNISNRSSNENNRRNQRITDSLFGDRGVPSRWSLLIECFFRPVSFATAHNLSDFDFELDDSMELLIERLALPNLWLTPIVPTDYLKYLPVWEYKGWKRNSLHDYLTKSQSASVSAPNSTLMIESQAEEYHLSCQGFTSFACNADQPPSCTSWIPSFECAICLDKYRWAVLVCGLPCGHHFHQRCIMNWLQRDNHQNNNCPICRSPAYRSKCQQ